MINLQALIEASKAALEELKNGTHEIITRSTPATWEDLREDLETKLIPILYELFNEIGGLKVIPTVTLPDGVTSTSLVSQSEMTQFVTNTLNVWMAALMEQVKKARKNTIYTFTPGILAYKYIPFTFPINVSNIYNNITPPQISVSKSGAVARTITLPTLSPDVPTISAAHN